MTVRKKRNLILFTGLILPVLLFGFLVAVRGQPTSQQVTLSNMMIVAELGLNCTTEISVEADVSNKGPASLDYFDLRMDVRSLEVSASLLDSANVDTMLIPEDRYTVLRVYPVSSLLPNQSMHLDLGFTTDTLQQRAGETGTDSACINHFIYYIRPLNEIQNLTFRTALPPHATLEADAAAPLFPLPTSNHTDGSRLVFTWESSVLYPGQELAFIVKYQVPIGVLDTQTVDTYLPLFVALAAVGGAITVLGIERLPRVIRLVGNRKTPTIRVVSNQEQNVLSLLERKGGSCPQREIYRELNLSQSMASMILNSLEERGLIKRFRDGRENVVHKIDQ
ncbi:MAG: helix-turn-helix transcriptional regulator [Promethearchaeota archaeon]